MHVVSAGNTTINIGDYGTDDNNSTGMSGGIVGLMQPISNGSGSAGDATCFATFKNCTIEKINIAGKYAGGLYGGTHTNTWSPVEINLINCEMVGDASNNSTINGRKYAGGLVAYGYVQSGPSNGKTYNFLIQDSKVTNYTITGEFAGGFFGYANADGNNNSVVCYIHDSSVEDCTLGLSGKYAGGIVGEVAQNTENQLLGYNIKLENITAGTTNMGAWIGKASADTTGKVTKIQFTGLGIYGTSFSKNIGNLANDKITNAAFIFADYTGQCNGTTTTGTAAEGDTSGESFTIDKTKKVITRNIVTVSGESKTTQTIKYNYTSSPTSVPTDKPDGWSIDETNGTITQISSGTAKTYTIAVSGLNKGTTVAMPKYPFVNVNPQSALGSDEILSGDGAVLYGSNVGSYSYTEDGVTKYYPSAMTMAAKIYAEKNTTGNAKQYYNTFNDGVIHSVTFNNVTTNYTLDDYMKHTKDDDGSRISTFATEQGISLPSGVDDFAVVVIASSDNTETTNLINRYIQLVTNTPNSGATANFANTEAGYHRIDIKKVQFAPVISTVILFVSFWAELPFVPILTVNVSAVILPIAPP